jgi:hypothetical protein
LYSEARRGKSTNFTIWLAIGVVLLITGFIVQWYPTSIVGGLEKRLDEPDVSQDERSNLQDALNSWRVYQVTTFAPMSYALIIIGILVLAYAVILRSFGGATGHKTVEKKAE